MSLLQDYVMLKNEMENRMGDTTGLKSLLLYQELGYRVLVLDTLKAFTDTVPDIEDGKAVRSHTKALMNYIQTIPDGNKFAPKVDETGKKARATALETLREVCEDACDNLDEYVPESQENYAKELSKILRPITSVWSQYRDTLIAIVDNGEEEPEPAPTPKKEEEKPKTVKPKAEKPKAAKPTESEEVKKAKKVACPIKQYLGMSLGEVLEKDRKAIEFLATKYQKTDEIKAAAVVLYEYAQKKAA